ncbi:hypothetical protein CLAFUR4_11563 [Fulvia fulva]|nr:hypothetical protein CLAFUR4_11563 [Fulvia fulva]WPV32577.1 hypothetical protein CLAFUW7_11562 [Fulvia fulva]
MASAKIQQKLFRWRIVPRETWVIDSSLTQGDRPVFQVPAEDDTGQRLVVAKEKEFVFERSGFWDEGTFQATALLFKRAMEERLTRYMNGRYGSWQSMFLKNPPCKKATIRIDFRCKQRADVDVSITVEDTAGVTFRTLLREVFDAKRPGTKCTYSVFHRSNIWPKRQDLSLEDKSLREVLQELSAKHGAATVGSWPSVLARGVVCPEDRLREEMGRGAGIPSMCGPDEAGDARTPYVGGSQTGGKRCLESLQHGFISIDHTENGDRIAPEASVPCS